MRTSIRSFGLGLLLLAAATPALADIPVQRSTPRITDSRTSRPNGESRASGTPVTSADVQTAVAGIFLSLALFLAGMWLIRKRGIVWFGPQVAPGDGINAAASPSTTD
ncbi:MAG TPA: hypothetical protein VEZ90_12310 [Blastocatellia bacterium]|nr:hypothetical protein [Blastocatellia bacterium]